MEDYIDRAALLDSIANYGVNFADEVITLIYTAPSVGAETVGHGNWVLLRSGTIMQCSRCKRAFDNSDGWHQTKSIPQFLDAHRYCPYCGVKME